MNTARCEHAREHLPVPRVTSGIHLGHASFTRTPDKEEGVKQAHLTRVRINKPLNTHVYPFTRSFCRPFPTAPPQGGMFQTSCDRNRQQGIVGRVKNGGGGTHVRCCTSTAGAQRRRCGRAPVACSAACANSVNKRCPPYPPCLISLLAGLRNIRQRGINDVTVSSCGFPETSRPRFSHCPRF